MTFILGQYHKRYLCHQSLKIAWKLFIWNVIQIYEGAMKCPAMWIRWTDLLGLVTHRVTHYIDVIMSAIASQITDVSTVCSTVCSGANRRKHRSSASLAFLRGTHRWPVDSPHKGPVTRKMFPFDDVIMKPLNIYENFVTGSNGHHFADDFYKCISLNENYSISLKISQKIVTRG